MPRRACLCVLCAVAAAALLLGAVAPPAAAAEPPVSFLADVAPVLKESCFACHDSKKKSGKYDMTTAEKLFAGGPGGEPVAPGDPEGSDFYTLLVAHDGRRMPPKDKGDPVPAGKAKVIERWIKEGAKLDPGLDPKADLVKELRARWVPPTPPARYRFPAVVNALAFTPDGKQLVAGGHHELTVWDVATGKLSKRVRTRAERAYALAFLPDGKLVAAGGRPGQEGDVRAYDLSAPPAATEAGVPVLDGVADPKVMVKHLLDADDSVLCLAVTPDGKRLAAGGCDRAVRVWDLSAGLPDAKLDQAVESHADWVLGVALSADGKYLATAARDKTAKVWDLAAKESVMTMPDHQAAVYGVALKPDGSAGFSVGADKLVRSWKPAGEGKQLKAGGAHADEVFKVVAGPTGARLATASADKTVRLWDADKVAPVKALAGLSDWVFAVAFSPDGSLVAGGAYDGEVRVWNAADGKVVAGFNASPGYEPGAK